ncbi:MAG: 3-deoxy-7-phosphoheptulonate synthase, partial [Parachlamydiaceae bacterium]
MKQQRFTTPRELFSKLPLESAQKQFIEESRATIRNILNGLDSRKLIITGPCSIHSSKEALEYAEKIRHLSQQVASQFFIVMRAYVEKPRTSIGWQGLINDPHLDGTHCLETGHYTSRQLLIQLAEMSVPTAC